MLLIILGLVNTLPKIFHPCENLFKLHLSSPGSTIVTLMVLVLLTISYIIHLRAICGFVITIFLIFKHEILPFRTPDGATNKIPPYSAV